MLKGSSLRMALSKTECGLCVGEGNQNGLKIPLADLGPKPSATL